MSDYPEPTTPQRTPLYQQHVDAGAQLIDFAGWMLPVHFGSQIEEHHAVRRGLGMFDVSHMTVTEIAGEQCIPFLRTLLANDIGRLQPGKAMYSCMLNPAGGIIDDLIVYYLGAQQCTVVSNSATRHKVLRWIAEQAGRFDVAITERPDMAIVAVQGPQARRRLPALLSEPLAAATAGLKKFSFATHDDWLVARTGYTGEDGFEVILPAGQASEFWRGLLDAGIPPCGLGARDTLRLEAGMALYGADLDEQVTPLESGLAWTVDFDAHDFIGRDALLGQRDAGDHARLIGLLLEDRGVLRAHQPVFDGERRAGEITSGTFSPTLERSIALARVDQPIKDDCRVEMRGKLKRARVVKYPFVRNGKSRLT